MRSLTVERIGDLPDPCSSCALWETGGRTEPACVTAAEYAAEAEWVARVRAEWGECGRIAYENGSAVGFVKYAPGRLFPQTFTMPSGIPDDDAVLIACLHVAADARDTGLGKTLLQVALRDLVFRGERAVEAYAASEAVDRERTPLMTVEFLLRQGFSVVRPHPIYPLMRLELRSLASLTDNVEAVLDALQLPRRVRERLPAPLVNPSQPGRTSR